MSRRHRLRTRALVATLSVAAAPTLLAIALVAGAGPLHRFGVLALEQAIDLLRFGAAAALAMALLMAVLGALCLYCRRAFLAASALVLAAASATAFALPWHHQRQAEGVPAIHDITTDTENPPAFVALAEAREAAPNALAYPGESFARQQREYYPEIESLQLAAAPEEVFERAVAAAHAKGWDIAASDADKGKLEATATTPWFGFRDDIVVRVRTDSEGTQVDVRSASRVGQSDLGTNARRIRSYLARLQD